MNQAQGSNEKKLTLLLLCWLFGVLGVHHFYTGKYLIGSLYLLAVGLTGLLGISNSEILSVIPISFIFLFWIVDIMRIIMGKFTDKEGKPIVDRM